MDEIYHIEMRVKPDGKWATVSFDGASSHPEPLEFIDHNMALVVKAALEQAFPKYDVVITPPKAAERRESCSL